MNIPTHLVLIPDGNRRWAKLQGKDPWEGHREGIIRFEETAEEAFRLGVQYVTFWGGSEANLTKRTPLEVAFLVKILKDKLRQEINTKQFIKDEVRFRFLGWWNEILQDRELQDLVAESAAQTKHFSQKNLTILFGYDGRREMLEAISKLHSSGQPVSSDSLKAALWTGELPPVDLVVRTGGEPHWSAGFMMWHTAESQLYFTETFWPAFGKDELHKALEEFSLRERRFGK